MLMVKFYRAYGCIDRELPRREYFSNLRMANKDIKIVCDDFNPSLYDSTEFIGVAKRFLFSKGNLSVIFNGDCSNKKEAKERLVLLNPNILVIAAIQYSNKGNIEMYWCPIKPNTHYTLADNKNVLIKEEDDILCFVGDNRIANKWTSRFEEMKKYCDSIDLLV